MRKADTTADSTKITKARPSGLAALSVDEIYPLPVFEQRTGLDAWALRMARRNGLVVTTVGRRKFVTGQAFADYLKKLANGSVIPCDKQ